MSDVTKRKHWLGIALVDAQCSIFYFYLFILFKLIKQLSETGLVKGERIRQNSLPFINKSNSTADAVLVEAKLQVQLSDHFHFRT